MNFKSIILTFFVLLLLMSTNSFAQNMYSGDTSAEAQTDTLTRGTYSNDLVPYFWDSTTAFDGKRSIRIEWDKKTRYISTPPDYHWYDKWISIANTPDLKAGETYTFSFYAKASENDYPINIMMLPSILALYVSDCSKVIKLDREWKRYSFTFVPKMKEDNFLKSYSAILNFANSPAGKVWYDAVQIEKGDTPTPYKNACPMNVGVTLNSPDWSNIYFPEDQVMATIRVDMPPGKAELQCQIVDYQGKAVKTFKQVVNGPNEIKLPLDVQQLGWFKVTVTLSENGKIISSHSANYVKIAKPVDIVPGIQPFSGLANFNDGFDRFDISKKIGAKRIQTYITWGSPHFGKTEKDPKDYDWSSVEWQLKRVKELGMINKFAVSPFSVPERYFDKEELAKAKKSNSVLILSSDKHEYWRRLIGELTRRYGHLIDEFELGAEDNGVLGANEYYMALYPQEVKKNSAGKPFLVGGKPFDDLCAMVKIGADEIRKTQPNMKIGAIRPSRSGDPDDLLFTRAMFKKIGKNFNIFPVDFYFYPFDFGPLIQQRRGKSDGLIEIYNEAKKITQEFGCNQPIYMSEFGWAIDVRFPDDSIYRKEQAETMAKDFVVAKIAGYYALDWHMGFDGVSMAKYSFYMQQNMKIQSIAASYSAAAQVVENVTESKWLTPDSVTRIAVMKKHDGKGVAAVWADKGYKLSLPANSGIMATDLMGNAIQSDNKQFSLTQAPIYIWHKDFKQLCDLLGKADIEMTEFCDIKFRMISESMGRLQFINLSKTKDIEISTEISGNGKEINKVIDIPKDSQNTCDIPLAGNTVKVKAKTGSCKSIMEKSFELNLLTPIVSGANTESQIAIVNSRSDIMPPDPWVAWEGPDDLSVYINSSWDENNLYLKLRVKDDKHFNKFPEAPWNADSIQFAIDPKNDGAFYVPVAGKKLGPDDFEFGLALGDDGKSRCVRSYGKNICESNNYTIARDEKEKTTIYELRLSWKDLGVKPYAGMVFGMSFVIFDDDTGAGFNYYAPIGAGIAGEKNPALYKKFVLK